MSIKKLFENVNLGEVEDLIEGYIEEHDELGGGGIEELIPQDGDEIQLWESPNYIHVPRLGVKIHDFMCCNKNEDGDYEADWCGWIFKDDITNERLYDEGYSSFYAAIHNFCRNFSKKNDEEFLCDVCIVSDEE